MNVVLFNEPSKATEVVSGTAEHVYYRGHDITNPNSALLQGNSLKITIHLYCLIPKIGNLIIPV